MYLHIWHGAPTKLTSFVLSLYTGACSVHAARLIIEDTDNPIICGCTDVDPHSSFLSAKVAYPCWEQEGFGACEQPFMSMAIREIDEGELI